MRTITRFLGAGAAVAAMGLAGAYAFAQQGPGFGPGRMGTGHGMMGQGHGPQMGNFGDPAARLTAVKSDLGIKPEQVAAWDAYAKVVTDTAAERRDHREHIDRDAVRNMQPGERRQHAAAMQSARDQAAAKVEAAAGTLLAKLDAAQQEKARSTLPGLVAGGSGPGMRHGMMGGSGMGSGMGPRFQR